MKPVPFVVVLTVSARTAVFLTELFAVLLAAYRIGVMLRRICVPASPASPWASAAGPVSACPPSTAPASSAAAASDVGAGCPASSAKP